jgi:hypothetical protein
MTVEQQQQAEQVITFDDLELPKQVPVLLDGKNYMLTELDSDDSSKFKLATMRSMGTITVDESGSMTSVVPSTTGDDVEMLLVHLSLKERYTTQEGDKLRQVTMAQVRKFRGPVTKRLYQEAMKINPHLRESGGITVEDIDKEITRLQKRREELLKREQHLKNSQNNGMDG